MNNPPISTKYQIYVNHPNFKVNYFEKINTKEKAYWLGFLFADGYFEQMEGKKLRIGVEISLWDRILFEKFALAIGFNPAKFEQRTRTLIYKCKKRKFEHITMRFISSKMAKDLRKHGLKELKSKKLEFPNFKNQELDLAFLLGFYDGEGWEGTIKFSCGSKTFVEQVKRKYQLPYIIWKTKSGVWGISLGSKLFNEMMYNYKDSLPRKRKIFEMRRYKVKHKFKTLISKEKLRKLVWEMPITEIAEKYRVWHHDITDLCEEWEIERPPQGYWNQRSFLNNKE